ncbi:hypothetical protein [uncultured Jatrophihabitans sp.]
MSQHRGFSVDTRIECVGRVRAEADLAADDVTAGRSANEASP